jgi:hypothetical protein
MKLSTHGISSSFTFLTKVVPIGLLIVFALWIYLSPNDSQSIRNDNFDVVDCLLPLLLVGNGIAIWLAFVPLKRVRMDDKALYISNYLTEIVVSLDSVTGVSEIPWLNYRPVTISFRAETKFGNHITFMPKPRLGLALFSSHPVVNEIRLAVTQATEHESDTPFSIAKNS